MFWDNRIKYEFILLWVCLDADQNGNSRNAGQISFCKQQMHATLNDETEPSCSKHNYHVSHLNTSTYNTCICVILMIAGIINSVVIAAIHGNVLNSIHIACCPLPAAFSYCLLPIAYCLLPIVYCLVPISYCPSPIAYLHVSMPMIWPGPGSVLGPGPGPAHGIGRGKCNGQWAIGNWQYPKGNGKM